MGNYTTWQRGSTIQKSCLLDDERTVSRFRLISPWNLVFQELYSSYTEFFRHFINMVEHFQRYCNSELFFTELIFDLYLREYIDSNCQLFSVFCSFLSWLSFLLLSLYYPLHFCKDKLFILHSLYPSVINFFHALFASSCHAFSSSSLSKPGRA